MPLFFVSMSKKNPHLASVNARLCRDKCRAKVVARNGRLYLQATLPPAPGSQKKSPHQQRIALNVPATTQKYFSLAETQARKLSWELYGGTFDWGNWREPPKRSRMKMSAEWVKAFEKDFQLRHSGGNESLWEKDYWVILKHLEGELNERSLMKVIERYKPDTKSRKRACMVLKALARFADIDIDLSPYSGSYGRKKQSPRNVPSDDLIVGVRSLIEDESWRWLYGMLAAYGLRPHEAMLCEFSNFPELEVIKGKTGARIVYPIPEEWAREWELLRVSRPRISGKTNSDLGSRVGQAFRRMKIPFRPYDLRHAWAIRSIGRVPDAIAAQWQGHSVAEHNETYRRWISVASHREAFERMKGDGDALY